MSSISSILPPEKNFFSSPEQRQKIFAWVLPLALFIFAFFVLSTVFPQASATPDVDHYVYQYMAQHILDGQIPYRDMWDHKGLIIYLIYALGLLLEPNYGLWILGYLTLSLTSLGFYSLYKNIFNDQAGAFFSSLVTLFYLSKLLDGGNSVEFYNLPLQLLSFYAIWRWLNTRKNIWLFLIGAAAGLSLFLRPNEAFLAPGFGLFLLLFKRKNLIKNWGLIIAGCLTAIAPFVGWLYQHQALADFYDIVWRFNFLYSSPSGAAFRRVAVLYIAFQTLTLLFIVCLGIYLTLLLYRKKMNLPPIQNDFLNFLLLVFPFTLAAELISARPYEHYFISWLPLFGFLLAFALSRLARQRLTLLLSTLIFLGFATLLNGAWLPLVQSVIQTGALPPLVDAESPDNFYVEYIRSHSDAETPLWVWGNNLKYNLLTDRDVPTKYLHLVPVVNTAYTDADEIDRIIRDLRLGMPLILDVTTTEATDFSIPSERYDTDPILYPLVQFIRENYVPQENLGPYGWTIWLPK